MTRAHFCALACALGVALACNGDNPAGPDPFQVRVFPADVFAGGEVFLAGDWYREMEELPLITVDTFTLVVRRVDDSTIAATLPATSNGSVALVERVPGNDLERPSVSVHGFNRMGSVPVLISSYLTPAIVGQVPYVVGGDSMGAFVVNLRDDLGQTYPGIASLSSTSCGRGIGPSYQPGRFSIVGTNIPGQCSAAGSELWQLIPDTSHVRHVPSGGYWVAEIAPWTYLTTDHHFAYLASVDSATGQQTSKFLGNFESNSRFYLSPQGDKVALRTYSAEGAAVLSVAAGDVAYRVPAITQVTDAAFSADGGRLYFVGANYSESNYKLMVVAAETGDSLAGLVFPASSTPWANVPRAIARDPWAPYLYVAYAVPDSTQSDFQISIEVLDSETLVHVATIAADLPIGVNCTLCFQDLALLVDRQQSELILALNSTQVRILHFSLPPIIAFPQAGR